MTPLTGGFHHYIKGIFPEGGKILPVAPLEGRISAQNARIDIPQPKSTLEAISIMEDSVCSKIELELELIQTQMAQKPMLRAEVYAHAMRASQNRKKEVRREKKV